MKGLKRLTVDTNTFKQGLPDTVLSTSSVTDCSDHNLSVLSKFIPLRRLTEIVSLRVVNGIFSALDNDNIFVLLLDHSAAFDTSVSSSFSSPSQIMHCKAQAQGAVLGPRSFQPIHYTSF